MADKYKAKIHVTLKKSVLDPQGQTILHALDQMGFEEVKSCRVGKFFELDVEAADKNKANAKLEEAAKDLLSNPVIEDYSIEIL